MFQINLAQLNLILKEFKISLKATTFRQLQRYPYEKTHPGSKQVRLMVQALLENGESLVIRFKNEKDVSLALVEAQCQFAELLRNNGIVTPYQYKTVNKFAKIYLLNGYEVLVTVEEFVSGIVKEVSLATAEKTGELLGKTHCLAEKFKVHVKNRVLFDPFQENDLFSFSEFRKIEKQLTGNKKALARKISQQAEADLNYLAPLKKEARFAVQGDISDENLYFSKAGKLGLFDFNRCGDNNLYCDVVMQGVFEARLMNYSQNLTEKRELRILAAFLKGYETVRPFSLQQKMWFPYLYRLINAFWKEDLIWKDHSLKSEFFKGNDTAVEAILETILTKLTQVLNYEELKKL